MYLHIPNLILTPTEQWGQASRGCFFCCIGEYDNWRRHKDWKWFCCVQQPLAGNSLKLNIYKLTQSLLVELFYLTQKIVLDFVRCLITDYLHMYRRRILKCFQCYSYCGIFLDLFCAKVTTKVCLFGLYFIFYLISL